MKEIKAHVRRSEVNKIVAELEKAGAPGITIVEVHPVGYGYEPNYFEPRFEDAFRRYGYLAIVKIEAVCADKDLDRLVDVIEKEGHSGASGDGMIFVTDVCRAVRIRNGDRDDAALQKSGLNDDRTGRKEE
jgi:nitrogen regulatory protein PII